MSAPFVRGALLVLVAGAGLSASAFAAAPFPAPPPEPSQAHGHAVAVLAGGCFWGMEGVFEHVKGVSQVTAGYAGGTASTANYPAVSSETTGHAESVRIVYDPAVVSYGTLLQVYFSVAHDPTQIERQYPDVGHSYRSAIFTQTAAQYAEARAYISVLNKDHIFAHPIVTKLESGQFYEAEQEHQHFLDHNPDDLYITAFDAPKISQLRQRFPYLWRAQPA